ncbi:S-layer protein [uncultured archaeon]|nr:S-layer protein [uncultured archaeon]
MRNLTIILLGIFVLEIALISGCIEKNKTGPTGEEINGTGQLPYVEIRVESISSPAYRGISTIAGLSFTAPDDATNGSEILLDYGTAMLHPDGSLELEPGGIYVIPEKKRLVLERMYLFTWDEIPGKDSGKLIEYLERMYFLLDWLKTAKIEKIENNRTIRVFTENNSILLKLNDDKTGVDLRSGIYAPEKLFAVFDNERLNIYDKQTPFERGNGQLVAYSNLTVKTSNASAEGDYLITATARYRGWAVGKNVFSFKIGKGGRKSGGKSMTEGSQNIGYSADNPPPLNLTENAEMAEVALRDPFLKGKMHRLIRVTSEYLDLENYSGFFVVVDVDVGDPDYPGEVIRYIVDREEKRIIGNSTTPQAALEYFRGEAFDEANGNSTKRWDALNFPGLWLDNETNTSTETLAINQSMLDGSRRVIEKHNLIYTTKSMPHRFQVFASINVTEVAISNLPFGDRVIDYSSIPAEEKKETYQAIGWQGEKHVLIEGNRIVKVLLEENASEVKTLTVGESWNMSEGYVLTANSIDAKAANRQAWFTLAKDGTKLYDIVLGPRRLWILNTPENDTVPLFITYFNKIFSGSYTDGADLKYTWLRSQDITEIKEGDIFGIMEVSSIDNGKIELMNREPVYLAPGKRINLMGNISIKVGGSNKSLSFYPYRVRQP